MSLRLFGRELCWLLMLLALFVTVVSPARAGTPVAGQLPVKVEEVRHWGLDRLVIWAGPSAGLHFQQSADELQVLLPVGVRLSAPRPGPVDHPVGIFGTWMRAIFVDAGSLHIGLAPGAHPRVRQLWNGVWVDADGSTTKLLAGQFAPLKVPAPTSATPAMRVLGLPLPAGSTAPAALPSTQRDATLPTALPATLVLKQPSPPSRMYDANYGVVAASSLPTASGSSTLASSATLLTDIARFGGPSVLFPMSQTGAAAFARAGEVRVVFDVPHPMDLSQLKDDPVFGAITERLLADGTELRLRLAGEFRPHLTFMASGWVLTLVSGPPSPVRQSGGEAGSVAMAGHSSGGVLSFSAKSPGRVVTVEDEITGARLLVGTQFDSGQRTIAAHVSPEFAVLPSWQGLVVQPFSDRVRLLPTNDGFALSAADAPALSVFWPDASAALDENGGAMTRRFDFPGLGLPVLRRRLAETIKDAAVSSHTAHFRPRSRVAQAMLAVGLDAEASAVLRVAVADDPAHATDVSLEGLSAIAHWISARAGGTEPPALGFNPASLGESDEAMLWRALWSSEADPAAAAALLATRWRLLMDYPEGLRRTMLPAVAELLERGGQVPALTQLLAAFPTQRLDMVRARQLAMGGKLAESLAVLDRLGRGQDRLIRAQARAAAVEARLSVHQLTLAQAADALDRQFYAWRGGDHELRLRLRTAELRAQSGDWRKALVVLREADTLYPAAHEQLHDAEVRVISDELHADRTAQLNALDLVALADEASHVLGATDADTTLAPLLAEKLLALDLPDRAEPILRRLLAKAGDGAPRQKIGLELAQLQTDQEDQAGALATLDATRDEGEQGQAGGAALEESRAVLRARVLDKIGRPAEALTVLAGHTKMPAVELQASIQEAGKSWLDAEHSLQHLVDSPDFTALPDGAKREVVLRAVRDAADAGDLAGLRAWRKSFIPLFQEAPSGGLFTVLTAEPVQQVGDLSRSGHELTTISALPASLSVTSAR